MGTNVLFFHMFTKSSNTQPTTAAMPAVNNMANAEIMFENPIETNSVVAAQSDLGLPTYFCSNL